MGPQMARNEAIRAIYGAMWGQMSHMWRNLGPQMVPYIVKWCHLGPFMHNFVILAPFGGHFGGPFGTQGGTILILERF